MGICKYNFDTPPACRGLVRLSALGSQGSGGCKGAGAAASRCARPRDVRLLHLLQPPAQNRTSHCDGLILGSDPAQVTSSNCQACCGVGVGGQGALNSFSTFPLLPYRSALSSGSALV